MAASEKPTILHLGDPITHNPELHERLLSQFTIINPPAEDLERPTFIRHLKGRTWGNFQAIMRPFWKTGGEMGKWDPELISLLPSSVQVFTSAGAGFDWVDVKSLAEHGELSKVWARGIHNPPRPSVVGFNGPERCTLTSLYI